jgi:hypothetical protein
LTGHTVALVEHVYPNLENYAKASNAVVFPAFCNPVNIILGISQSMFNLSATVFKIAYSSLISFLT